jgi:hypothetical protein
MKLNMTRMRLLAMSAEEAQAFIQFQVQNADVSHVLWFADNHWIPNRPIEEMMIEELKRSLAWIGEPTGGTKEALQARLRAATAKTTEPVPPVDTPSTAVKRTLSGTEKLQLQGPRENSQRSTFSGFSFGTQLPRSVSPIQKTQPAEVKGDESPVRRAREAMRSKKIAKDIDKVVDYDSN